MPDVVISGFKGLNLRDDPSVIDDAELSVCTNFDIGRAGELNKRTGFEQLHAGATLTGEVKIIGHFLTSSFSQLIAVGNGGTYYSNDGSTWVLINARVHSWAVQYGSAMYLLHPVDGMFSWSGSAYSAVISGAPSGTFGFIFKERLFVVNTTGTNNSRLHFSKPGDLTTTGWVSTNFIDVRPGDGDFLVALAMIQDILIVFKGRSTWGLYVQGSSTADWVMRNLNTELGCISKFAVREIEGFLYFSSARALIRTDGTSFEDISRPIYTVLKDRIVNLTTVNIDSFGLWDNRLICHMAPNPSTDVYYVYHTESQGWSKWEMAGSIKPTSFIEIRTATPTVGLYCGDRTTNGRAYRYGANVYTDVGLSYDSTIETKLFDFDTPVEVKRGKWAAFDIVGAGTVAYTNIVDGTSSTVRNVSGLDRRAVLKAHGPGYFRTWKVRLVLTSSNANTLIGIALVVTPKRGVIKAQT